jgi:hypothetical protein|tara:strand:+ start:86 stop:259 length:174 start_codon:yes stop_codon:yes gene_type:complete
MTNDIQILEIEEHEDGSATLKVECDPVIFGKIFNHGFVDLIKKGIQTDISEMNIPEN